MKLLLLVAIGLAIVAVRDWRETGEMPEAWLIQASAAALALAFLLFLYNPQTRPRLMLQFLAAMFAAIALFAFAADYSAARATGAAFHAVPLIDRLTGFAPTLVAMLRNFVTESVSPWLWDPLLMSVLGRSPEVVFVGLAALFGYVGRRRKEVQIFSN